MKNLNFITVIYVAHNSLNPSICLLVIIYYNLKRNRVTTFLSKIYNFDESLKKLQWKYQVQNQSFYFIFVVLIGFALIGAKVFFVLRFALESGSFNPLMFSSLIDAPVCVITLTHFILSSLSVLCRLKALCKNFKKLQKNHSRDIWIATSLEKEKQMLKNVTKLYYNLIDAIEEINSVFSLQVKLIIFKIHEQY
jgi:hypothetical protein